MGLVRGRRKKQSKGRLSLGQVVWRLCKGKRTRCIVQKRGDGRLQARPQISSSMGRPVVHSKPASHIPVLPSKPVSHIPAKALGNKIGGRIHCFWWSSLPSLPDDALRQMRQWSDAGFHIVLWSYKSYKVRLDKVSIRDASEVHSRRDFDTMRENLPLQHVKDLIQLKILANSGGWFLDFDMIAVQPASQWCVKADDSAGLILFSHPMRSKGSVMCRTTADWVDPCWGRQNSHRASFALFGMFADPAKSTVREFLRRSIASMESVLLDLASTLQKRPRRATKKWPAIGSGSGARAETWAEWMRSTTKVYEVASDCGFTVEAPMLFSPYGPWLGSEPPTNTASKKHGADVPCISQVLSRSLGVNVWSRQWSADLQLSIRASCGFTAST
jgi:hypothetical protein